MKKGEILKKNFGKSPKKLPMVETLGNFLAPGLFANNFGWGRLLSWFLAPKEKLTPTRNSGEWEIHLGWGKVGGTREPPTIF